MLPLEMAGEIVIITSADGEVNHDDVVETLTFLADNPSTYQGKKLLIIDQGSDYDPSQEEVEQFSNLIKSLLEKIFPKIALVVPQTHHFGIGRMVEVLSESIKGQFRAFKELHRAQAWLDS